ncbi:hypothetical protein V7S43_006261 [Phytophthora oleae]|uniref:PiggyBac transposable element-derived protein domain-containing protein n=1 Tax=Phytophthora oleae TaxID=2107226 RepID=A0ABD3FQ04_9STRA
MVGKFTDSQVDKVKKMHRIRRERVQNLFQVYKNHNSLYGAVERNDGAFTDLPSAECTDALLMDYIDDDNGVVEGELSADLETFVAVQMCGTLRANKTSSALLNAELGCRMRPECCYLMNAKMVSGVVVTKTLANGNVNF